MAVRRPMSQRDIPRRPMTARDGHRGAARGDPQELRRRGRDREPLAGGPLGRVLHDARAVGLGQDDDAAGHRRVSRQPTPDGSSFTALDVTNSPPYDRAVNTVFQDYALFPHMSVLDNVAYGLRVKGVAKRERAERAAQALEMVRPPRASPSAARSSSPAASASAWPSRGRSSTGPACCCSTSRWARST